MRPLLHLLVLSTMVFGAGVQKASALNTNGQWDNAPNAAWFGRQHNSNGGFCCDGSDAYLYYGAYDINQDGSVSVPMPDGSKLNIEASKVLPYNKDDPNPTGTVVWWHSDQSVEVTYCFALGTLG